ncbi:MAG: exodeoxyribonuclease VII small subunit [Tannerella sp.]|jgi:exodeoxyribonuclease VII small subunit|nr:exodeoxyribonuclease VII small subunit [Tannerella sp.]
MEKEMTYAESVQRLRAIMAEMEQGRQVLTADVLLEKVKEAGRLIRICREKLFRFDGEVKKALEELQ